jgi:hypothetical protein
MKQLVLLLIVFLQFLWVATANAAAYAPNFVWQEWHLLKVPVPSEHA